MRQASEQPSNPRAGLGPGGLVRCRHAGGRRCPGVAGGGSATHRPMMGLEASSRPDGSLPPTWTAPPTGCPSSATRPARHPSNPPRPPRLGSTDSYRPIRSPVRPSSVALRLDPPVPPRHQPALGDSLLRLASLPAADLTDANLTAAYLLWANLTDADLTGADLGAAIVGGADLTGAILTDANLAGVGLLRHVEGCDATGRLPGCEAP